MQKEQINRYIPIIILLLLVSISIFIIKDYIVAIIGAFILAYLVYPVHKKLAKKMPGWVAASTTLIGLFIIILLPIGFVIREIISQISSAIQTGALSRLISSIENIGIVKTYNLNISDFTNKFFEFGVRSLSNVTVSVAASIISLLVMIFVTYYLLLDWQRLSSKIKKYIPFKNKDRVISEIADTTKKIVHGTLLIAILEAIAASLGFWLAGIDFFLILASLIALFAFIPGGPAIVWVPALIVKLIQGSYLDAGIILVFGLFISIYLDTILRIKVAGKDKIHPVIMILGIIGGTPIMGLAGIIVGPLLLSYTIEILEEVLNQS